VKNERIAQISLPLPHQNPGIALHWTPFLAHEAGTILSRTFAEVSAMQQSELAN